MPGSDELLLPLYVARFRAPRYWPTWALLACLELVSRLPFPMQLRIGSALGSALPVLMRRRRRVVEINLATCFPELSAAERDALLQEHFRLFFHVRSERL